jgi:hypothetical protein
VREEGLNLVCWVVILFDPEQKLMDDCVMSSEEAVKLLSL